MPASGRAAKTSVAQGTKIDFKGAEHRNYCLIVTVLCTFKALFA